MRIIANLFTSLLIISFLGCANVSTPMGGPEDETPPKLLSSIPEQGQTNYKGQSIYLTFDEWVNTKNIETDVIITPRVTNSFKSRVKKNVLEITFFEPLKENTTYSLNFGSTIQDITNNNPAENLNLSFSTGPYIDSLTISGNVKSLLDQEPAKEILVALYSDQDTTNILNGIASYFTNTDTTGNYLFRNLPPGNYRVYATKDKNRNSKADAQTERYGFYPDTLKLTANEEEINFTIQNLNTTQLRRLSARHFGEYFDITFNKEFTDFQILNQENLYYRPEGKDKMRFFRNDISYGDTLQLIYTASDSLNTILQDTVGLYFSQSKIDKTDFTISTEPSTNQSVPGDTLIFRFSKPLLAYNLDSIQVIIDSTTLIPLNPEKFKFNQYRTELNTGLHLTDFLRRNQPQINVTAKPSSFISADRDSSDIIKKDFNFTEASETAIVSGQIITSSPNIIVQLLNANTKKVIRESYQKSYRFEYLAAGRYMVRVIDDRNNNKRLDIGNILTNEIPEDVYYYFDSYYQTKVIEVRKNWENGSTNISF